MSAAPLVFAHRGSSAELPEHTLDAYTRAIEEGADGLECDVRLTRDGHLVCIHDRRLDRTSNGRGRVSAATLDELEKLDFGYRHGSAAASEPRRVLTLDRLLGVVLSAGRPLRLLIETKHPSRYGAEVEQRLIKALQQHGLAEPDAHPEVRVAVMSFSALALRRVHQLAPGLETVFLFELAPPSVRNGRAPFGAAALGPGITALRARPQLVERARAAGKPVYVWTVNSAADIDLVARLGVEGIISDRPGFVLGRLGRGSTQPHTGG